MTKPQKRETPAHRKLEGELYFASSIADGGEVIWLLEMAKKNLLEVGGE